MWTFSLTLGVLLLAAAGLGVGATFGRPLLPGCREGAVTGHALPRCAGCAVAADRVVGKKLLGWSEPGKHAERS